MSIRNICHHQFVKKKKRLHSWFGAVTWSSNPWTRVWTQIQYVVTVTCETWRYIFHLWHYGLCQTTSFWLAWVLWWGSAALRCDPAAYSVLAGSEWCDGNRQLLCFWGLQLGPCSPVPKKRALLMVACFMKYPTRVSVWEQKCSFGVHMYVPHRGTIV